MIELLAAAVWISVGLGLGWLIARVHFRAVDRAVADEARYQRLLLTDSARWFSEDPPTAQVIHDLAHGRDVAQVRDDWRRARAALTTTAATPQE